jgi:uncharacterized protein (UPF0218 family)
MTITQSDRNVYVACYVTLRVKKAIQAIASLGSITTSAMIAQAVEEKLDNLDKGTERRHILGRRWSNRRHYIAGHLTAETKAALREAATGLKTTMSALVAEGLEDKLDSIEKGLNGHHVTNK